MKTTVLTALTIALVCCCAQAEEYKPGEIIIQLNQSIIPKTQQGNALEVAGLDALGRVNGVYFYRINSGGFDATKKMIILK